MAYRKWTPSKTAKREFAQKMNEIDDFCREHGIQQSASSDSYYFSINGKSYRVSNHSVEASNARAFTNLGEQIREKYHPDGREEDVIYIHASKTRIKEIYNNLVAGYELDGRGNIKDTPQTESIEHQGLSKGSKVKVHMYDLTRPPEKPEEIKTKHYGETFEVKEQNGKLGIDWNIERSPYTCNGEVFTPFDTFASSVVFEDIETGKTYSHSNITNTLEETNFPTPTDLKYELTDIRQSVSISGESLYRIKALKEFENEATGVVIEKGQLGGFVQSENNLSQDGTCWIDDNARVFNNAKVTDNAYVGEEAMLNRNVEVKDNAVVSGAAWITQNAKITDNANVSGMVMVKGNALIKDEAIVCGNHSINGNTEISTGIHDGTAAPAQITMQSQSLEM